MSSTELTEIAEARNLSLDGASLAALLLPAIHPLLRPAIGVGSHLLWLVHVLPAALLTYRYGRNAVATVLPLSPLLILAGERLFGAGYGSPASWQTAVSLAVSIGGANLLVAGFAVSARQTREELAHFADHDALTDLPNRRAFRTALRDEVEVARTARESSFALAYVDLDRFTRVNNSLGHPVGDDVLRVVAERLDSAVRPEDVVARIGGDEFLVLFQSISDADDALASTRRVLETVRAEPIRVKDHSVVVTASAGVALWTEAYDEPDALVRDADAALAEASAAGPGSATVYREEMHAGERVRLRTENALRAARQRDEFELHYQPLVRAEDATVRGAEALLRWRHPSHGLVSPGDFLPVIEDSDLLEPIGCWVLERAARQGRQWAEQNRHGENLTMSVNVSARQLTQSSFLETAGRAAAELGDVGGTLQLELTEAAVMEDAEAGRQVLERLRGTGARLAVDDFGTGYSSLRYLHELPVDTLKIDRAFVCLPRDEACESAIARTIVALAESLDLTTVAEGIEEGHQAQQMIRLGVDHLQGYWFGKPLPASGFETRHLTRSVPRRPASRR